MIIVVMFLLILLIIISSNLEYIVDNDINLMNSEPMLENI